MSTGSKQDATPHAWPAIARTALRVGFGLVWAIGAAFTWTPEFAVNYVGYLHNAAQGQPEWSAWWFNFWIALVTPRAMLFVWLTRLAETALALALLLGFARKTTYILGLLFSLLIWSTAEGFGGPYTVGASNMGAGLAYVLIFIALLAINHRAGPSIYSLDRLIEQRWPAWRRIAESHPDARPQEAPVLSRGAQAMALGGIALLVFFLVAGLYSSMHVKAPTPTAAASAVSPLQLASSEPVAQARDATLPPLVDGPSVDVEIDSTDVSVEIASGVHYQAWTFGDEVPGPVIRVRQGQMVNIRYTNRGTMQHSVDFHAAMTPPSLNFVDIMPGETIEFSFEAKVPGAFVYHCGTAPVLLHMANGMYGALIVEPAEPLPPADREYVLVQSEWYTQQVAGKVMAGNWDKMLAEQPDEVVFNGVAFQYNDHPLTAEPGERVRLYMVNAGPNLWSAFHVIGAIFDKVYPDGDPANAWSGVSTQSVAPGAGMVFDLVIPEAGDYTIVDHDFAHLTLGAAGVLRVGDPDAAPRAEVTRAEKPAAPPRAVPGGPYSFDAERAAALYAANCGACHQASGEGLPGAFPSLVGNSAVLDADPSEHLRAILDGMHGKEIDGVSYPTAMPPFADALNDHEIADIANHERASWGNDAPRVTDADVRALRGDGD